MQTQQYYFLLLDLLLLAAPFLMNLYFRNLAIKSNIFNFLKTYSIVGIAITLFVSLLVSRGDLTFNSKFLTGTLVTGMPIEVVLFLFAAPFASIALYEFITTRFKEKRIALDNTFFYMLAFTYATLTVIFSNYPLTANVFLLMTVLMFAVSYFKKNNVFLTKNFFVYSLFSLIAFILVALVLTSSPFITHTTGAVTGFYLGSIPFEEFFFSFFISSVFLTVYYLFKKKDI